MYYDNLKKGVS